MTEYIEWNHYLDLIPPVFKSVLDDKLDLVKEGHGSICFFQPDKHSIQLYQRPANPYQEIRVHRIDKDQHYTTNVLDFEAYEKERKHVQIDYHIELPSQIDLFQAPKLLHWIRNHRAVAFGHKCYDAVQRLLQKEQPICALFFVTPGGGCGGAWDETYHVYLRLGQGVKHFEENDCSCASFSPGHDFVTEKYFTPQLYEEERQYVNHSHNLVLPTFECD